MENSIRVDFTGQQLEENQDYIDTKGKIGFEIVNKGTASITVEGIELKRGDHEQFIPPIPGAVFNTNKRISIGEGTLNATVIYWIAFDQDEC